MSNTPTIDIHILTGNLFADTTGIDTAASVRRYVELVEAAVTAAYPDAEITITTQDAEGAAGGVKAYTNEAEDPDAVQRVDNLMAAIWQGFDWLVYQAGTVFAVTDRDDKDRANAVIDTFKTRAEAEALVAQREADGFGTANIEDKNDSEARPLDEEKQQAGIAQESRKGCPVVVVANRTRTVHRAAH